MQKSLITAQSRANQSLQCYSHFPPTWELFVSLHPPSYTFLPLTLLICSRILLASIRYRFVKNQTQLRCSASFTREPVVYSEDSRDTLENAIDTCTKKTNQPGQLPYPSTLHPRYASTSHSLFAQLMSIQQYVGSQSPLPWPHAFPMHGSW